MPAGQKPPLKQALIFEAPTAPSARVMMVLKNGAGKELLRRTVSANRGRGGLLATFERPGTYSVELRNANGTPIGQGVSVPFSIDANYEGIEVQTPLVGGEPIDSNQFTGKRLQDFDVVLRWIPVPGIDRYHVVVYDKSGAKTLDEVVTGSQFALPKGKVGADAFSYQIHADYPNGYVVASKKENFFFSFISPTLTLPKDGEQISLADPEVLKQNGIFFSWRRTTFTLDYEFEISLDAPFTNVMKRVTVKQKDNFLVFRNLKPRDYWWRVRAVSGERKSSPTPGFKITVTP